VLLLLRRARRRLFWNELFSQGANTASVALVAFILLLLVGSEVLSWAWLIALPAVAAALGIFVAFRRCPSWYVAAQIVDSRMGLFDAISTAWFYRSHEPSSLVTPEIHSLQAAHAEQVSQGVDVRKAVPFRMPRAAYALAGLVLLASSLFALRFGIMQRLDLKPPLASIFGQRTNFEERKDAAKRRRANDPKARQDAEDNQTMADAEDRQAREAEPENEPNQAAQQSPQAAPNKSDSKENAEQSEDNSDADSQNDGDEEMDGVEPMSTGPPDLSDSKKDGSGKPNDSGDSNSIFEKIKDTMQNLLSKVKAPKDQQNGEKSPDPNGKQPGKSQQSGKQQASKDGQQQGPGQGQSQEGEAGEQAQNSQESQAKNSNKSDAQKNQQGSGVGSQDGDKSIKQAEQLAAMGKISEILGKRAANLSGEATVEVQSTKQTLHTPYAQRGAQHTQGGAEINRDEVPVALQNYVQQYFEQVRKQPATSRK
jgi:hypothetical protein